MCDRSGRTAGSIVSVPRQDEVPSDPQLSGRLLLIRYTLEAWLQGNGRQRN